MSEPSLKPKLEKLGLRQTDFARLLDVSARTVNLWATGAQPVPGSVAAYLRLLEVAAPDVRAAEVGRVIDRSRHLRDGIYGVAYRAPASADEGRGTAVLRNGKLTGADVDGNLFCGCYRFDRVRGVTLVDLRLGTQDADAPVEPGVSGPLLTLSGQHPLQQGTCVIASEVYEIELRFLGPLPE